MLKIDSILPICMNKTENFKGIKKTDNFSKQCIGTRNKNGEIEVWINCSCSGISKDSFKYFITTTHDGGPCYFKLKLNLNKKDCFNVFVNGF